MKRTFITVGDIVIPYLRPEKPRSWAAFKRELPGPMDCTLEELKIHQGRINKISNAKAISCLQHILPPLAKKGVLRLMIHKEGMRPEPKPIKSKTFTTHKLPKGGRCSSVEFVSADIEVKDKTKNSAKEMAHLFAYKAAKRAEKSGRIVTIENSVGKPGSCVEVGYWGRTTCFSRAPTAYDMKLIDSSS